MPMWSCTKARLTKQRCWLPSPVSARIDLSSFSLKLCCNITQGGDEVLPVRHPRDHVDHGPRHDAAHHQPGGPDSAQLLLSRWMETFIRSYSLVNGCQKRRCNALYTSKMLPLQKLGDIQKYISVQQESVSANWTQYEKSIYINYYVYTHLGQFQFFIPEGLSPYSVHRGSRSLHSSQHSCVPQTCRNKCT